jgi:hypothetical protein
MRLFALRAVLMLTLAILGSSAISAGLALRSPSSGSDVTYMLIVMTVTSLLVAAALVLTRGSRELGEAQAAPVPPELV